MFVARNCRFFFFYFSPFFSYLFSFLLFFFTLFSILFVFLLFLLFLPFFFLFLIFFLFSTSYHIHNHFIFHLSPPQSPSTTIKYHNQLLFLPFLLHFPLLTTPSSHASAFKFPFVSKCRSTHPSCNTFLNAYFNRILNLLIFSSIPHSILKIPFTPFFHFKFNPTFSIFLRCKRYLRYSSDITLCCIVHTYLFLMIIIYYI